jgi:Protein of unknown function (DUF3551)
MPSRPAIHIHDKDSWEYIGAAGVTLFAEEAIMRTVAVTLLALAGMSLTGTPADAGSWCANYRRGVSNCTYSSYEQCYATAHGLAAYCAPNPFPGTAYGTAAGSWNAPASPRRYRRY